MKSRQEIEEVRTCTQLPARSELTASFTSCTTLHVVRYRQIVEYSWSGEEVDAKCVDVARRAKKARVYDVVAIREKMKK